MAVSDGAYILSGTRCASQHHGMALSGVCGGSTLRRPPRWAETLCVLFFLAMIAVARYTNEPWDGYVSFAIFGALPLVIAGLYAQRRER